MAKKYKRERAIITHLVKESFAHTWTCDKCCRYCTPHGAGAGAGHRNVSPSLNQGSESKEKTRNGSIARKQVSFHQGKAFERIFEKRSLPTGRRYTEK